MTGCEPDTSGGSDADGEGTGGASTGGFDVWELVREAGDAPEPRPAFGPCDGFATDVVSVTYGPGAGFGQDAMPAIVLGPPEGGGATQGSLDVVTLGNGGAIVLGFGTQTIVDGPGPDFIVFENAFWAGGDPTAPFAEPASIAVSADGETWAELACVATEPPFEGCAGWNPVYANALDDDIDPHDPAVAGGEAFDLAAFGVTEARFVRITDRADLDGFAGSFDLDAVALVHSDCATR